METSSYSLFLYTKIPVERIWKQATWKAGKPLLGFCRSKMINIVLKLIERKRLDWTHANCGNWHFVGSMNHSIAPQIYQQSDKCPFSCNSLSKTSLLTTKKSSRSLHNSLAPHFSKIFRTPYLLQYFFDFHRVFCMKDNREKFILRYIFFLERRFLVTLRWKKVSSYWEQKVSEVLGKRG